MAVDISVPLPYDAVGLAAVCDGVMFWTLSLTFYWRNTKHAVLIFITELEFSLYFTHYILNGVSLKMFGFEKKKTNFYM